MELERVEEDGLAEVSQFLCSVFGLTETPRSFQLDVLRWKYILPHPYWDGSRSYCLRQNGEIAAHGCVVPTNFLAGSQIIRSCVAIDWAGSPKMTGSGALMFQFLYPFTDVFMGIGGSVTARKVIPRLGFDTVGEFEVFVRVVRPVRDFSARSKLNWRSGAHLARNTVRLLQRPGMSVPPGLSARRVDRFDETICPVLPRSSGTVVCQRSPALLNYLLACPAVQVEGYAFYLGTSLTGYCLLSRLKNQCHIADLWSEDLSGAYALALRLAADSPGVSEVIATASTSRVRQAIVAAGFFRREVAPIFVRDPQGLLGGFGPPSISSVEDDFFYR